MPRAHPRPGHINPRHWPELPVCNWRAVYPKLELPACNLRGCLLEAGSSAVKQEAPMMIIKGSNAPRFVGLQGPPPQKPHTVSDLTISGAEKDWRTYAGN